MFLEAVRNRFIEEDRKGSAEIRRRCKAGVGLLEAVRTIDRKDAVRCCRILQLRYGWSGERIARWMLEVTSANSGVAPNYSILALVTYPSFAEVAA
jgi:hypothetical protein